MLQKINSAVTELTQQDPSRLEIAGLCTAAGIGLPYALLTDPQLITSQLLIGVSSLTLSTVAAMFVMLERTGISKSTTATIGYQVCLCIMSLSLMLTGIAALA